MATMRSAAAIEGTKGKAANICGYLAFKDRSVVVFMEMTSQTLYSSAFMALTSMHLSVCTAWHH